MQVSKTEEEFLVEAEKVESTLPCFDALALRKMGLSDDEVRLLQVFFFKGRSVQFIAARYTKTECLRALISSLRYLPRTDRNGVITLESYQAGDNIYGFSGGGMKAQDWHDAFRYEFGYGSMYSHKERVKPALLAALRKVYDWIVAYQKAHNIFQELPGWLQAGMEGDFESASFVENDQYEDSGAAQAAKRPEVHVERVKGGERNMENYLRIRVEGKEGYLKAFLNANKEKGSEPDYKGEGVAVWVNQMEAEQQPASQEPAVKPRVPAMRV